MKMWIARDEDGRLFLFNAQPYRVDWKYPCKVWESEEDYMRIKDELYPEVTFENSPMEVELKLIEK